MHPYSNPQGDAGQVQQLKGPNKSQHVQGHVGDVHRMSVAVAFGQAWCDHVGVSDRLHLKAEGLSSESLANMFEAFGLTATFGKVSRHIIFQLFIFSYGSLEWLLINETQWIQKEIGKHIKYV